MTHPTPAQRRAAVMREGVEGVSKFADEPCPICKTPDRWLERLCDFLMFANVFGWGLVLGVCIRG